MSINNSNTWEVAEKYVAGMLSAAELSELQARLASDTEFANEFNESANLVRSIEGSGKQRRMRSMLKDIHAQQAGKQNKKAKLLQLPPHFWRTAAVAAGVAIITTFGTYWTLNPSLKKNDSQYNIIRREVANIKESQNQLKNSQKQLEKDLKKINTPPPAHVKYTGTGFALTNDGYFVTSNHVIDGADSVYIQDHNGEYFKAVKLYNDAATDLAVLRVEKKNFHFGKGEVPYTFAAGKSGLGAKIYTIGFPKDYIKYSEGYISARNGYDGDDLQYTLELPAGHGQSGSPLIDDKGNILGVLTAIGSEAEDNTYAVSSKALIDMLHKKLPDNTLHLPKTNKMGKLSREEQIKKMECYTFSVKVYKK